MQKKPTFAVKFLLFIMFFLGIALTIFVVLDAEIFHVWTKPPGYVKKKIADIEIKPEGPEIDRLRQSIVLIESRNCDDPTQGGTGTGFVVKVDGNTRYIATNAHVIRNSVDCEGLSVIDHTGDRHRAEMVGISQTEGLSNDLAVIKVENIEEGRLVPLELLNSEEYKTGHDGEQIITIGYPVVGLASTYDKASVSGPGLISQFDTTQGYFITSSLSINAGNSGGPVFIGKNYKVLGIVVAKAKPELAENVAMVIPIDRFKDFFKEKTGGDL
jgi:S1-C subfamily serine protease